MKFSPFNNIFTVAILVVFLLNGCEKKPLNEQKKNQSELIVLRFGHDLSEDSAQHLAAVKFAKEVNQKTAGKIEINIYPNQSLGTDRQMLAMAQQGELDFILTPTAKLSHVIPELQIFDLPFLFPDTKTAHKVLDGTAGTKLLSKLKEYNLIGIGFWESGVKQLTLNKPIATIEDFKNTRFRIMESNVLRDQFSTWGAESIVIDFGKTYDALKNNIVDGQENPLNSTISMKFHQVQKYLYLSNHGYLAQLLAVSQSTFDKLSNKQQEIIIQSALNVTPYQRTESQKRHDHLLNHLKTLPIQVAELPTGLKSVLQEKSRNLLESYRMMFGTEIVEQVLQAIDEDKIFKENELVIAIDADLSGNSALSGLAIRRGVELAIAEINQQGGVLGKRLVLTARDNSMIPARGLDNLKRFSEIPNLVAVFGGISSPVVLAELEFIHKNKLIFLDPWAAATPIVNNGYVPNYVFRVSVRDEFAAEFLTKHALNVSSKVGLLLVNNGWGRSNHKALMNALNQNNFQPAKTEWFEWGKDSFGDTIEKLYEAGVEVIIYVGNPVEAAKIVQEISRKSNPIPIISHWGITGGKFTQLVGKDLDKVDLRVLQTFSFVDNKDIKVKAFVEGYKAKYSVSSAKDIVAPVGTAHAYDLTHLLAKAIKLANSTEPEKIQHALESITYHSGLVRDYSPPFSKQRHDALDLSDFILTHYKNNRLVPFLNNETRK